MANKYMYVWIQIIGAMYYELLHFKCMTGSRSLSIWYNDDNT
jgi:hypothetical protein